MRLLLAGLVTALTISGATAQGIQQTKGDFEDKFRQLDEVLPSPNVYRNAAGEPGHEYWQQEADYSIQVSLDEPARRLTASSTITYKNNSPDTLRYLWLQLDQNRFREDSIAEMTRTFTATDACGNNTTAAQTITIEDTTAPVIISIHSDTHPPILGQPIMVPGEERTQVGREVEEPPLGTLLP